MMKFELREKGELKMGIPEAWLQFCFSVHQERTEAALKQPQHTVQEVR